MAKITKKLKALEEDYNEVCVDNVLDNGEEVIEYKELNQPLEPTKQKEVSRKRKKARRTGRRG